MPSLAAARSRGGRLNDAAFALAGAVVGYLLKIIEGWLTDARGARRSRAERRQEFQRVTLLELQDAMADLVRAAGEIYHFDTMQIRATGQRTNIPPDMSDRDFKARRRFSLLKERVLDDELRRLLEVLAASTVEVEKVAWMRGSEAASEKQILAAAAAQERANARLGVVLRDLY